jgi:hypothetical protein
MQLSPTLRLVPIFVLTLLLGCDSAPASAPENDIDDADLGPVASMIRNPVNAETQEVDTSKVARLDFEDTVFEFGEVDQGTVVKHDFPFTNTGSVPLLITKARSTCGCTVPSYPEEPLAPGETGIISVAFDTKRKYGRQRKPVTIIANTYPAMTTIYVDGTVINEQ